MLTEINTISEQQSKPTELTNKAINQLLGYSLTNHGAGFRYKASDMVLHVHNDVSNLSKPKARIRAGGHYFFSSISSDPSK